MPNCKAFFYYALDKEICKYWGKTELRDPGMITENYTDGGYTDFFVKGDSEIPEDAKISITL